MIMSKCPATPSSHGKYFRSGGGGDVFQPAPVFSHHHLWNFPERRGPGDPVAEKCGINVVGGDDALVRRPPKPKEFYLR